MTKPLIQIGDEVREMTNAEYEQWQADNKTQIQIAAAVETQIKARDRALAKLVALGLTNEEIAALVG
jgi:DNA-binding NarL/FixJ family response regulator